MDDESRYNKKAPRKRASNKEDPTSYERYPARRKLKTYQLSPPDYTVDAKILIDDCIEKEVKYAGTISNVPIALDSTNRTEVLRVVDEGRRNKVIPGTLTADHDAILSLSVNNIKISRRDGVEEMLARIPIYEVATICYIRDDAQHCLAIKYGKPDEVKEFCHLAVLFCPSRSASEELCSLVGQCFQHVYTEAALGELENAVNPPSLPDIFSQSLNDTGGASTTSTTSFHPGGSESGWDDLQEYMTKLQKEMKDDELDRFNHLLTTHMEAEANKPFHEFCDAVLKLYGPQRKHLLAGLRKFIQKEKFQDFDLFLRQNGILEPTNGTSSLSSDGSRRYQIYRRTESDASQSSFGNNTIYSDRDSFGHEAIDHIINDFTQKYNSISIDTNPKTYIPKT